MQNTAADRTQQAFNTIITATVMSDLLPIPAGRAVTIRPIRLTDQAMEADFIRRLSPQAKHYRFLGGVRDLSPKEIERLCNVDGRYSMAFVATVREGETETEIGVSRNAANSEEDTREIAVTIGDEWQYEGLGQLLMKQLIDFAKAQGVRKLYSIELPDNTVMGELAKE